MKKCSVPGCNSVEHKSGICSRHYQIIVRKTTKKNLDRSRSEGNEITIRGRVAYISMYDTNGFVNGVCLIDACDVPLIEDRKWCLGAGKYVENSGSGGRTKIQKLIFGELPDGFILDHINRDRTDNRSCNIRVVTVNENRSNMGKRIGSLSKYIGVSYVKNENVFCARLYKNNKKVFCERFKTEVEAAMARDRAAMKYNGKYACLNFPVIKNDRHPILY